MSYILDALKKADADRARDAAAVPDLYAQADAVRGARAAARAPGWALPAGAIAAIALVALSWWWMHRAPEELPPALPMAQAPNALPSPPPMPPPPPMPSPAPAPLPAPVPVPPPPAPAPVAAPSPAPSPAPVRAEAPAPLRAPARHPAAAVAPPQAKPARAPDMVPVTLGKQAPAASAATEARLLTYAELPADIRSQLPALAVGGSMYSPSAASRMVILNGQVFREGDKPVDGLAIEQIGLKSTVLAFRGLRFELKH